MPSLFYGTYVSVMSQLIEIQQSMEHITHNRKNHQL